MSSSAQRNVDVQDVRKLARRWTKAIVGIQAIIVALFITAASLNRLGTVPGAAAALVITIQWVAAAAFLIGLPGIVMAPMLVLFCCVWTMESRWRTVGSVAASLLLSVATAVCVLPVS